MHVVKCPAMQYRAGVYTMALTDVLYGSWVTARETVATETALLAVDHDCRTTV